MIAVLLLLLGAALAEDSAEVKNSTAAGSYDSAQDQSYPYEAFADYAAQPQNFYGGFDFAQYGYGFRPDVLINTHVCSVDASYPVYSRHGHHRRHRNFRRPHIWDCSDAFSGVYQWNKADKGYTSKSCDKCCKTAARLDGMTVNEILGMVLVLNGRAKCSCCAPYRPIERVVAVPVQQYQPYPPYQQYQPTYQPAYPQGFAPPTQGYSTMGNSQPTGY
ncbi:hypothetical protein Q1695_004916 [Nippostrongylus brasiliensis]|nr:hypothetical protein Q1695_004916 [Nippostrongylus brasiliensis]